MHLFVYRSAISFSWLKSVSILTIPDNGSLQIVSRKRTGLNGTKCIIINCFIAFGLVKSKKKILFFACGYGIRQIKDYNSTNARPEVNYQ